MTRINELNGWRAISILLVLAAHLLPLGPKVFRLNETAGIMGMALFFILSGFLITSFLLFNKSIKTFLIRRAARIVPLSWLFLIIVYLFSSVPIGQLTSHFLFYGNLSLDLIPGTSHFWSLCLEMQFYLGIALLICFFKDKTFFIIPILCIAITLNSAFAGTIVNIQTHYRADEILAGCVLALIYHGFYNEKFKTFFSRINPIYVLPFFILSCMPYSDWFNYLRPYLTAILVGSSILNKNTNLKVILCNKYFEYIATVSFALYVIHGGLVHTWLGTGDILEKYIKRPILFLVTFALAHWSTYKFEIPISKWARRYESSLNKENIKGTQVG